VTCVLTHDEIVELADAVGAHEGIASGIGSMAYGAQLVVQAATSDEAVEVAMATFTAAAAQAGPAAVAGDQSRDHRRGR
jgi:hypothetical protein